MGPTSKSNHLPDLQLTFQSYILCVKHLIHVQINIHGNPGEISACHQIALKSQETKLAWKGITAA